jgi:hypothetical protein
LSIFEWGKWVPFPVDRFVSPAFLPEPLNFFRNKNQNLSFFSNPESLYQKMLAKVPKSFYFVSEKHFRRLSGLAVPNLCRFLT